MKLLNWKSNKGGIDLSNYGKALIRTWEFTSDLETIQFDDLLLIILEIFNEIYLYQVYHVHFIRLLLQP